MKHPKIAMVFQELKFVTKRSSSSLKASISLGYSILLRNERLHAAQKSIRDPSWSGYEILIMGLSSGNKGQSRKVVKIGNK